MEFTVEHISNMIFITDACGQVWKSWDDEEFTERKLANAMKKIQNCYNSKVNFVRAF